MLKTIKNTILVFLLSSALFAQIKEKIDHIGINDGLSMSAVYGIVQDENGFVWIGTQEGLNRFDGYEFKIYKKEIGNKNSLKNNYINDLILDKFGNIWISNGGQGVDRFNIKTNTFTHFSNIYSDSSSLISDEIFKAIPVSNGNVWFISTYDGLCRYNYKENNFSRFFVDADTSSISGNIVTSIFEDNKNQLWISSLDGGIDVYNQKDSTFIRLDISEEITKNVSSIIVNNDKLYIGTYLNGINVYDLKKKTVKKILLDKKKIRSNEQPEIYFLRMDSKNNLWVGTYSKGIYKVNLENQLITLYSRHSDNPINNDNVTTFMEDKNGIIWIGTLEDGINLIKPHNKLIQNYTSKPNEINTLSASSIFGLIQDGDKILWAGTQGAGLNRINRKTGKINQLFSVPSNEETLSHNQISSIVLDNEGYLWVGTLFGLNRYDRSTGKFKRFYYSKKSFNTESSSLSSSQISALAVDKYNNLWIGTNYSGLNKLDASRTKFSNYYNILGDDESMSSNDVTAIFIDSEGYIWTGSWLHGLNRLDPETEKVKRFIYDENNPNSLQTNSVYYITEDSEGFIWIGSSEGLIKFDKKSEKFYSYKEEDGLPNNSVFGILEDEKGFLWVSTNRGLAKFNKKNEVFKIYDEKDGFQGLEFNGGSAFKTDDGELIFGGYKGISAFYPENIKEYKYKSKVAITEFKIGNEKLSVNTVRGSEQIIDENISYKDKLEIPHYENNISISYSAMNYFAPEKIKYSYRLEGLENEWVTADNRRFVSYSEVPPGSYIFRVKSTNNEGLWNQDERLLSIVITPPFWQTLEFKIVSVILLSLLVYAVYRMKVQSMREQQEKLEQLVEERTRELVQINNTKDKFFSIIAHDLKNPFVSLLGFTEILHEEGDDLSNEDFKEITTNLRKSVKNLYGLLNNLLSWSTLQTGQLKLKKEKTDIKKLVLHNIELYKSNAERKNINMKMQVPDELFGLSDENMINTILRNLLSNAIKFTPEKGKVNINAIKNNDFIEISVEDTGIGLTEVEIENILNPKVYLSMPGTNNEEGTGIGLSLCREMLEKNGGKLKLSSTKGKGSTFTFVIQNFTD